ALAEAEIEYQDKRSPSIYVSYDVKDGKGVLEEGTKIIIWTTTPWTIPASLGISLHPHLEYVVVEADGEKYVVAHDLLDPLEEELKWEDAKVVSTRSEEHTSELQSRFDLVCRLLLEKKKKSTTT